MNGLALLIGFVIVAGMLAIVGIVYLLWRSNDARFDTNGTEKHDA